MSKSKESTPVTSTPATPTPEASAPHDTPITPPATITLVWGTESIDVVPGSDMHRIAVRGGYHLPSAPFICDTNIVPIVPMFSKTGSLVHVGHVSSVAAQPLTVSNGNGGTAAIPQSALRIGKIDSPVLVTITAAAAADAKLSPVPYIEKKQKRQ